MRSSTPRNAVRVGFTPTPSIVTAAPGIAAAAAAQNAAEDRSPGTAMSAAASERRPRTVILPAAPDTSAPKAARARSV